MKRLIVCVAVAGMLLALGPAVSAVAAEAAGWGVVDRERLEAEYRGMQEAGREFQELARIQQQQLQQQYKTRLLYDEEKLEFLDLSHTAAPTEAREKRLSELEQLSDQREQQLTQLRQNKQRTPQQEEEYKRLNDLYEKRTNDLATLQAQLQQERQAKGQALMKQVTESIAQAAKAVAEEKKLTIVLHKEVVLYGGVDVTDEVLEKLNAEGATKK